MSHSSPAAHAVIALPDYFPNEVIAEIVAAYDLPEPVIQVRKNEPTAYAAFEWTIPTVVMLYIGKTFIDAFAKELAKEYATKLVTGTKALALRCKELRVRRVTSTGSPDKLSPKYYHSAAFSIVVELKNGLRLKMLFDEALTPEQWEEAIDGMLTTVATNYLKYPEDMLTTSVLAQTARPGSALYVAYSRERETWELHNDMTMLAMQHGAHPQPDDPSTKH